MYVYIHTYIHTYMHTCMHTCIHTCMHAHIYIYYWPLAAQPPQSHRRTPKPHSVSPGPPRPPVFSCFCFPPPARPF